MGRTLHYDIFGDLEEGPVPEPTRKQILDVQRRMNHSLTWTAEQLALELYEACQITYGCHPPRPWAPRLGDGFTKVGDNEWNAALVLRFLHWISVQLPPKAFVRLHDEGDYVVPGYVILNHGELRLDDAGIERQRAYLKRNLPEYLESFEERVAAAHKGRWFEPVSALDYADVPEIAMIRKRVRSVEFRGLTLEGAADRIVFPWQEPVQSAA